MKITFNRIVAYGDSYTAGDELMDHVFMNISFEDCNRIKREYIRDGMTLDAKSRFREKYNISIADKELNCNHSWAAYLAKHLNVSFVNKGVPGSSIDQIYFTIYNDLLTGQISETDLVLVGLSTPFRVIDFRNEKVKTLLPNHLDKNDVENNLFIDLFTDDFAMFHYFKTVQLLCNLNSKINIRLQPMLEDIGPNCLHGYKLKHTTDYIKTVWNANVNNMLLPTEFLRPVMKVCGFGHPPVESHIQLADIIYNQINL